MTVRIQNFIRDRKRTAVRLLAAAVCVLMLLLLLHGASLILERHSHIHDHSGALGGCSVCQHADQAVKRLRELASCAVLAALLSCLILNDTAAPENTSCPALRLTPVVLGVRANN